MPDWWEELQGMSSTGGLSTDVLGGAGFTEVDVGASYPDLGTSAGPTGYPTGGYPELAGSPWENAIENAMPSGGFGTYGAPTGPSLPPSGALGGWSRAGTGGTEVTFDPGEWVAFFEATHPRKINEVLEMDAREIGNIIRDTMHRNAPKDTGLLANTIAMDVTTGGDNVEVKVHPTQPYAGAVEAGTGPHLVSISAIAGWAERHGIPPGALRHHILLYGTQAHPYIEPTIESVDQQLQNVDPWGHVFGTGGTL